MEENLEPGDRVKQGDPSCEEAGGGSRLSGNQGRNEGRMETSEARASPAEGNKAHKSQLPKVRAVWGGRARWDSVPGWEVGFHLGVPFSKCMEVDLAEHLEAGILRCRKKTLLVPQSR